ncbi:endonuclease/exonuclease/phosphatase family protein [Kaistella anthropi]|nr:endonuclease/exonuclease/phosphatase family protein [Kaistella anthropi]
MKNISAVLLLLMGCWFQAQQLNVVTFNIRLSVESDKENSWNNRKTDVLQLLDYYHPDIFGVQEAVPQQMTGLKTGLKNYDFVGVGRDDGANKGEYSAIFMTKTKFKFWNPELFGSAKLRKSLRKVGMQRTTEFARMHYLK